MTFTIEDLKEKSADLLNLLTKHLPDMLWVKDIDGKYLYVNQAICDGLLMAKNTQEPIGKGDVFFALRERELHKDRPDWHTFGELCFNSDQVVIDENQAMKFEEYGNVKGKLLYLEVYKAPFYDKDGNIIGTVGGGRDITKLKKIQTDLEKSLEILEVQKSEITYQANYDKLTNLPNRILLLDRLKQSIITHKNKQLLAVLFIDLDNFKEINDSFGHHVGDEVLIKVSKRLLGCVKATDTLSRFGGDEFCIVLNQLTTLEDIPDLVVKITESLQEPLNINDTNLYVNISVGISTYPNDGESAETLLKNADAAMYKAKQDGKSTYRFYDEAMTKKAYNRIYLESALREAVIKEEFVVFYQPQMDASIGKIVGMEALVRWKHPTLGLVFPDDFIPLAEETGIIVALDRLVMKQAIEQFLRWTKEGLFKGKISINLAIKQLEESDFIDFLKENFTQKVSDLNHKIEFEVTETQIMNNPEHSIEILEELNALGISIAVDDFGTGYSSLAYLKRLPISKLKMDKSFIDNVHTDEEDAVLAKTIINLSKNLNLKVIAEGVECKEQKDFLLEHGCHFIQGYFYSRPLPVVEMHEFLKKYKNV